MSKYKVAYIFIVIILSCDIMYERYSCGCPFDDGHVTKNNTIRQIYG